MEIEPANVLRIHCTSRYRQISELEVGQLGGIGKIAFPRYERGETQAPAPLVKLLRLVDQHPELLSELGAL